MATFLSVSRLKPDKLPPYLGVFVDEVLEVVVLRQHRLADDVVEVDTHRWHQGCLRRLRQPRQLLRLLVVLVVKSQTQPQLA